VFVAVAAVRPENTDVPPAISLDILLQFVPSEIMDTESLAVVSANVVLPSIVSVVAPSSVTAFVTSTALIV